MTTDSDEKASSSSDVCKSIACITVCSSLMLVANKVTIHYVPMPATVFCIQLAAADIFILSMRAAGKLSVDSLDVPNVKRFLPYIACFVLSVYSNGRSLAQSNVETVIVFRSCSPLFVSVLDAVFLGRELPSAGSLCALLGVVAGAVGFVLSDSDFLLVGIRAYGWVSLYLVMIVFEMTYGKLLMKNVKFTTPVWGSVFYTNALGLPPMMILAFCSGEIHRVGTLSIGSPAVLLLCVSSFIGIGISWAGWNCRSKISATAYTLVGVSCKMISVLLNAAIWDRHASATGIFWLFVCLLSSTMYRQAPLRLHNAPAACRTELALAEALGATAAKAEAGGMLQDTDEDHGR